MRTLYLLRHAKSSYPTGVDDFDRPLNGRGKKSAKLMGNYIKENLSLPDKVLCSSAMRAKQTAERVVAILDIEERIEFFKNLYLASSGDILRAINLLPDEVDTVMVVGHNPGIAHLAEILTREGNVDARARMNMKYSTAGLAILNIEDGWSALEPRSAMLRDFIIPKQLEA